MRAVFITKIVTEEKIGDEISAMVAQNWDFIQLVMAAPKRYVLLFKRIASS